MRVLLLSALLALSAPLAAQSASLLAERASASYNAGDYAESGRLYAEAIEAGARDINNAYNAACAFALAGDEDPAFDFLHLAADLGFANVELLTTDSDLDALHDDPRWPGVVARYEGKAAAAERLWDGPAIPTPFREDLSEDEKVAGLSRLWSEAKYNFANFDLVPNLDWDSLYVAMLPRVRETGSTLEYYRVLMETVAHLRDGHSNVYLPNELAGRMHARPGLRTRLVEGRVLVTEVVDPALRDEGLAVGQEVLQIDGMPVHEYARTRVRPYQSSSTEQDRDVRTYEYSLLTGDEAESVDLVLASPDGTTLERTVPRLTGDQARALAPARPAFELDRLPGNVVHVRLTTFSSPEAADAFEARFAEIESADALILDVRNNGGGNGAVGFRVLCALTDSASIPTAGWRTRLYRPAYRAWGVGESMEGNAVGAWPCDDTRHYTGPAAVLTSPRTFSAAEDFAVAFDLMDAGPIVGEATGGSTGQPLSFRLPGGGSGRVTSKRDAYPDGTDFVGTGVLPDVPVEPTVEGLRAGRDPVLEAAVEALRRR